MSELLAISCCCGPNLVWEAIRCPTIANPAAPPIIYIPASMDLAGQGLVVFLSVEWGEQCYSVNTRQVGIPIGNVPPALLAIVDVVVGTDCAVCELPACMECAQCADVLAWTANVSVETQWNNGDFSVWQWTANGTVNKYASVGQPVDELCVWSPLKQGGPQFLPWSGTFGFLYSFQSGGSFGSSCSLVDQVATSVAGGLSCVPYVSGDPFSPPSFPTETMWVTQCAPLPSSICNNINHPCSGMCVPQQRAVRIVMPRVPGCYDGPPHAWATTLNPTTGAPECWAPVIAGTAVCVNAGLGLTTFISPSVSWT